MMYSQLALVFILIGESMWALLLKGDALLVSVALQIMSFLGLPFVFVCIGFKSELRYYLHIVQINFLRIHGKVTLF